MSDERKEERIIHRTRMLTPTSAPKKREDHAPPSWSNEMKDEESDNEYCILL
jgi:hypothetical protein